MDRRIPAALLAAFLLHNVEEALTFDSYREASQSALQNLGWTDFSAPTVGSFLLALAAVSLAAGLAMTWALLQPSRRSSAILVKGLAWIMLLNVLLPHLPAAVLFNGYTPGLLTALFINVPVACFVLLQLRTIGPELEDAR